MDFPITLKPAADLVPYERNARTHSKEQIQQIKELIRLVGFTNPILEDEQGIIAGHGRQMAALEMYAAGEVIHGPGKRFELPAGMVPVIDASGMSDAERRAYILADNQVALNAGWDDRLVGLELQTLKGLEFNLATIGFDDRSLVSFMATTKPEADPEETPEPPAIPTSKLGDLWLLGDHRIICGDCTDAGTVAALLSGEAPHLMVTDPPYGVEYDPAWREKAGVAASGTAKGKVLNDDKADWREAWALFPGDVAYVWHDGLFAGVVGDSLAACDFHLRSQIIWDKGQLVLSRGDYHWEHEPCWYAVKKGAKGHWAGDRKQTTVWHIAKPKKNETGHGTQKPVECMKRPIENNSSPGQAVYDPFMGSGTTIIAAEMTGRRAFGCELSPAYVDVIVKRWEAFTGKAATLEGDGRTFADIAEHRAKA